MRIELRIPVAAIALVGVLGAQESARERLRPIESTPRVAGAFDVASGRFVGRNKAAAAATIDVALYNNTCIWTGGNTYLGAQPCETDYDEGRIPLGYERPNCFYVGGSTWVDSFQIAYCTYQPTGQVDIDFALFDTNDLGGACLGAVPPIGESPIGSFTSAGQGFPLPGSTALGTQACWIVTLINSTPTCITTGVTSADLFNFSLRSNNSLGGALADGWVVAGDPAIPAGSGTYGSSAPCGHGLGSSDIYWGNFDDVPVGGPPSAACPTAPIVGTNCFWFGGYPSNAFANFWLVLSSQTGGGCWDCFGNVAFYCTSKTNSLGCVPAVSTFGKAEVFACPGGQGPFDLTASSVINNKSGLWFYGTNGPAGGAFQGGHLCVKTPIQRLSIRSSGGNPPPNDCSGSITEDFNDKINGIGYALDPALTAGAEVNAQCWSRDPASPSTTSLTRGVQFTICP